MYTKTPAAELHEQVQEENKKFSLNGDPQGYLLKSLELKLSFAPQDNSLYATITLEELSALEDKVMSVKNAIQEMELDDVDI